jgi:hypothetical protein
LDGLGHIAVNGQEVGAHEMRVCFGQRFLVFVQGCHSVTALEEAVANLQTNTASTSGHDNNRVGILGCFHG